MRAARLLVVGSCAVALMLALPALCYLARNTGPAERVVFREYFPVIEALFYGLAAVVGGMCGGTLGRALVQRRPPSGWKLPAAGACVLLPWVLLPTVQAFPAAGSVAERDAWARAHVRYYEALGRVIGALPVVQADVGRVRALAPTSSDRHVFAREMNGDDMRFAFEVVGERGRGKLYADCTLDDARVYDWRAGLWKTSAHEVRIERVPPAVPAP